MLTSIKKRQGYKMHVLNMFIIADFFFFLFLIKLRWPKTNNFFKNDHAWNTKNMPYYIATAITQCLIK